jgi:hypothetical protein
MRGMDRGGRAPGREGREATEGEDEGALGREQRDDRQDWVQAPVRRGGGGREGGREGGRGGGREGGKAGPGERTLRHHGGV